MTNIGNKVIIKNNRFAKIAPSVLLQEQLTDCPIFSSTKNVIPENRYDILLYCADY